MRESNSVGRGAVLVRGVSATCWHLAHAVCLECMRVGDTDLYVFRVSQRTSACLGSAGEVDRFNKMVLKK